MPLLNTETLRVRGTQKLSDVRKSVNDFLREENHAHDKFDIFLSHSFMDSNIIVGLKEALEDFDLEVYVDWIYDTELSRDRVMPSTADRLRNRMATCTSLVYVSTANSEDSLWMPWELGYFDGLKGGKVAVLPISNSYETNFKGQE